MRGDRILGITLKLQYRGDEKGESRDGKGEWMCMMLLGRV